MPPRGQSKPSASAVHETLTDIEVEGELRYREFTPAESDRSVRVAEIHANSILVLDRSDRQPISTPEPEPADEPID